MQVITTYTDRDVLCGRGGGTLRHAGNKKYRNLIKSSKPVYLISSKNEKTAISRSIVAAIRRANGRFLERSQNMKYYYDIGDAKATEKTSQALREGQPKLRKRMMDDGIISDDIPSTTAHMLSLLPTASTTQIKQQPVLVGDDSYSSVNKNDIKPQKINQQRLMLEQSLKHVFTDIKPVMDDRYTIGDCRFHPTNMRDCQIEPPKRIVTPPATPPAPSHKSMHSVQSDMNACESTFHTIEMEAADFDDSNSIMTFEMDDEEMIDDDEVGAQPIFPISTPSPSLTNHFRALNELKGNVPIYDKGDQQMFSDVRTNSTTPIMNHLRALTELKDQVPTYPSSMSNNDLRFNNSNQFNRAVSQNTPNASWPSFVQNQTHSMQVNF